MAELLSEALRKQSSEFRRRFFSLPLPQSATHWHQLAVTQMLDCFPVGVALLDENLVLRYQNRAYAEYVAQYSADGHPYAEGRCFFDYLPGSRQWTEDSFRHVMDSRTTLIEHNREIRLRHGEAERQTFWNGNLAALIDSDQNLAGVALVCQDTSFEQLILGQLIHLEECLQDLNHQIEMSKQAIRFLMDIRSEDKRRIRDDLLKTTTTLVVPLLERVKRDAVTGRQRKTLDSVLSALTTMAEGLEGPCDLSTLLTPKENQVFQLIRTGRTTKEIADILCVSSSAVSYHRGNIRKKERRHQRAKGTGTHWNGGNE